MLVELTRADLEAVDGGNWLRTAAVGAVAALGGLRAGVGAASALATVSNALGWAAGAAFFASPVGVVTCAAIGVAAGLYLAFGR